MRAKRITQASIFEPDESSHLAQTLNEVSGIIDAHPHWLDWVEQDLGSLTSSYLGREGLSVESVLRCLIAKQFLQVSYRRLSFMLSDSLAFSGFARLVPFGKAPSKSALQASISRIRASTLERMNVELIAHARESKLESATKVRIDSTVTETNILSPMDNRLLRDSVRVCVRLLRKAREMLGPELTPFINHLRMAKRRELEASSRRGENRVQAYRALIGCVERTVGYLEAIVLEMSKRAEIGAHVWLTEVEHYRPLIAQVIDQTRRRVIDGEEVPANEKIVSLFEPHTDIIVKDRRGTYYGHKLNLSTGESGLVLDVVIEAGNPADSERLVGMIDRHIDQHEVIPKQVATDGGYASKANLDRARERGVKDMVFHKKRGLEIEQMASSRRVYHSLRRFRAGLEAGISYLKRCFGLKRCNWKGLNHFKAYVWSSVFTHNLFRMGWLQANTS